MKNMPYHHGNLRNKLIETGIELISEEGVDAFSLRKVAVKCGVSHAAPYSHFADINQLSQAMNEYVTEKFMEKLTASIQGEKNSYRAVSLLGDAYISFFSENPHYYQFLFYLSKITINLDSDEKNNYPPFLLFKETAYKMFCDMGIEKEEFTNNLIVLWSTVHGIASLLTNKGVSYSGNWNSALKNNSIIGGLQNENDHT